jgi:hypothetical protein
MNCAMWHAKKMWLQSSTSPQREQHPFDGPCRLATCSLQGSLPRMSCQRKTLIVTTPNLQQTRSARYAFHHNPRIIVVIHIT